MFDPRVCYVSSQPPQAHKPEAGSYDGKPRLYCSKCGAP